MSEDRTRDREATILDAISDAEPWLKNLSRDIWACRGLGFEEHDAVRVILAAVSELGSDLTVEQGVGGLETAFRVSLPGSETSDGPHVAMLAEYDAVPDLGHACGHNIISASMVGALLGALRGTRHKRGRFSIIGTPAEEGGGGKMIMYENGAFADVDAILMFHPKDINTVGQTTLPMQPLIIEFHGHSANAASFPYQGKNALDALMLTYVGISALRQQLPMDTRLHGIVTQGGNAPNNIPDLTRFEMLVRSMDTDYLDDLVERVRNVARGAALATGCSVEFPDPPTPRYDSLLPNERVTREMREVVEKLGVPLVEDEPILWASNDAGRVSQVVPTALLTLAIGPRPFGEHRPEFAEAAVGAMGDDALQIAAKVLALTGMRVFADTDILKEARAPA